MGYWNNYNIKEKLKLAWAEFKSREIKFIKNPKKAQKLSKLLKKRAPNTSFELLYKLCYDFKMDYFDLSKEDKIERLIELSKVKIYNKVSYKRRRGKKHYVSFGKRCWVCPNKANIQHHIILISNGGYDSGINRICICEKCHELIHSWLGIKKGEI